MNVSFFKTLLRQSLWTFTVIQTICGPLSLRYVCMFNYVPLLHIVVIGEFE